MSALSYCQQGKNSPFETIQQLHALQKADSDLSYKKRSKISTLVGLVMVAASYVFNFNSTVPLLFVTISAALLFKWNREASISEKRAKETLENMNLFTLKILENQTQVINVTTYLESKLPHSKSREDLLFLMQILFENKVEAIDIDEKNGVSLLLNGEVKRFFLIEKKRFDFVIPDFVKFRFDGDQSVRFYDLLNPIKVTFEGQQYALVGLTSGIQFHIRLKSLNGVAERSVSFVSS